MAALTSSNVRVVKSWIRTRNSTRLQKAKQVEVYNTTVTAAGGMPAAAFGFTKIDEASVGYYKSGGGALAIVPNEDQSIAYLFNALDGTTTPVSSQVIADTPNGLYFTVFGY